MSATKNVHNFGIFQPIWLKFGMESLNGRTQHMHTIFPVKPAYHPTSLKVKNAYNFAIFQPIWLKFGMEFLYGKTQHMYVIYLRLSILTSQTNLPPNQLTGLKVKNFHKLDILQSIWLNLGMESLNGRTQHMHTFHLVKPAYHLSLIHI